MRYYWDTIDNCVPPEQILAALDDVGLIHARCDQEFDIFRAYIGEAPAD
ncbi:MAG: hypothetical protein HC826_00765 [Rhodospirillales bacterium]|nr:hypothetical protein [Rhodospirillales bacterium]